MNENNKMSSNGQRFYKLRLPSVGRVWESGAFQPVEKNPQESNVHLATHTKHLMHILFDLVIPFLGIYIKTNVQDVQGWAKQARTLWQRLLEYSN